MPTSLTSLGAVSLFVDDPERSKDFYRRVFELEPVWEDEDSAVFKLQNTLVNLLKAPAARDLIAPATVGASDAGARMQLTIWVEDANAACEELGARGVELLNGPLDRDWGMRTAAFADPDGHIWEVAQNLEAAAA